MKFGARPKEIWHCASELNKKHGRLYTQINRLMLLDHIWKRLVGDKERFWNLLAVQNGCLLVSVKLSVARNELIGCRQNLVKEINKHFDKPWIKKIEIVKDLGASNE